MKNPASVRAEFYICTKGTVDDVVLLTVIHPNSLHQSYPNRMHGGVIAALLDESVGRAAQIVNPDIWAVTIDLNIKFRKPTPLDQPLYIESRVTDFGTRAYTGEGKMFLKDGTVTATCTAKYFLVKYNDAFGAEKLTDENYFLVPDKIKEFVF